MKIRVTDWVRICLINLLLVASAGLVLRYKMIFPLPWVDQKHLLHGHSHFAFSGWISQLLMVLLLAQTGRETRIDLIHKYRRLLLLHVLCAYGMLISFPIQGYGWASITCSTAEILVFAIFSIRIWKELNNNLVCWSSRNWFRAAVAFGMLSSLGAFCLAGMMAGHVVHQNWYLAALYFFLHFQYNGWFLFACGGLLWTFPFMKQLPETASRKLFYPFLAACIPAYFLSALWLPLPKLLYGLIVAAAIIQVVAWCYFLFLVVRIAPSNWKQSFFQNYNWAIWMPATAFSIKLLLQLGSTIPELSKLAFGFRSIVIGYLHLTLLGIVSLFLITLVHQQGFYFNANWKGYRLLLSGIITTELLLLIQGVAAIGGYPVLWINEGLLAAALLMWMGIARMITIKKATS